jgi:mRNA-degrading endonuclease RelE of RelBE toxin-antitoxin system
VLIIETSVFTRRVGELLSDEQYRLLQGHLVRNPEAGVLIKGGEGLRKLRWGQRGKGKSGGVRVIYYWAVAPEQILMLFVYPKNEQADLTAQQAKTLAGIVRQEYP